jgi:hypothetical protein
MQHLDTIPWDSVRYCDRLTIRDNGQNAEREGIIQTAYPPPTTESSSVVQHRPMILMDMHGVILAWHLPNILPTERQVCMGLIARKTTR